MRSVAIVNASGRLDGITLGSLRFADVLEALGYSVAWYQCVDRGVDPCLRPGGHLVSGSALPVLGMGLDRLWEFPRKLRDLSSDLVVLSDPTLINIARGRPITVVRVHDLRPLTLHADRATTRWMFRYAIPRLRSARRILVTTEAVGRDLAPWGIPAEQVRVIPETHNYGLHPDHVGTSAARIRSSGVVRVLCVSTDRPFKNLQLFVDLASAMQNSRPPPRFEFTLVSRLRPSTEAAVRRHNLPNLRVLSGLDSLADAYDQADVYVHPSLYEGFGRPLIESMAFGLPVVARRTPSIEEVVGSGGVLLSTPDVAPWTAAIRSVTAVEEYSHRATAALERARAFLPDQFQKAVAAAFEDL